MQTTRWLSPADKIELAADMNGLPHARITDLNGTAYVFTAGLADLEQWARWFMPLGCHITHQPAGTEVVLWTLHAVLGDVYATPVLVHALALDTDLIDDDLAQAVA